MVVTGIYIVHAVVADKNLVLDVYIYIISTEV